MIHKEEFIDMGQGIQGEFPDVRDALTAAGFCPGCLDDFIAENMVMYEEHATFLDGLPDETKITIAQEFGSFLGCGLVIGYMQGRKIAGLEN